ncbi:MAG: choice-of-anchor M domain-containing protein, partial [Bifidobacteriaceae bacterium]|nr:choice-of-anchor M domain-containing protein [Bifidobacteriaceae bacterium]
MSMKHPATARALVALTAAAVLASGGTSQVPAAQAEEGGPPVAVISEGDVSFATQWLAGATPVLGLGGDAAGEAGWIPASQAILSVPYQDEYWPGDYFPDDDQPININSRKAWNAVASPDTRDWRTGPPAAVPNQYTRNKLRLVFDLGKITAPEAPYDDRSYFRVVGVTAPDGNAAPGYTLGYPAGVVATGTPSAVTWDTRNLRTAWATSTRGPSWVGFAFSAPGVYCVDMAARAGGVPTASPNASAVYTFAVGIDPAQATVCPQHRTWDDSAIIESGDVALAAKMDDLPGSLPELGIGLGETDWITADQAILSLPYRDTYWPGNDYPEGNAGQTRWSTVSTPETRDWRTAPPTTATYQYTRNQVRLTIDAARIMVDRVDLGLYRRATFGLTSVTSPDGGAAPGTMVGYPIRANDGAPSSLLWDSGNIQPEGGTRVTSGSGGGNGWAFSAPGVYCVTMAARIGAATSEARASATYTVAVGVDPATATPCAQPEPIPFDDPREKPIPVSYKSTGHVDLSLGDGKDGEWELRTFSQLLHDAVWAIRGEAATLTVPEPDNQQDYTHIGAPGTTYWGASASGGMEDVMLWPGLATDWSDFDTVAPASRLSWTLRGVSGPGDVWIGGDDPSSVFYSTVWGLPASYTTSRGAHDHMAWSFTKQGVYCLNFNVSGRMADGTAKHADGQLTIAVGDDLDLDQVIPCERQDTPAPVGTLPPIGVPDQTVKAVDQGKVALMPYLDESGLRVVTGLRSSVKGEIQYS